MISILTPVYNRSYIINVLYQSLLKQTDKNFEWIIIDDGSSDNLSEIVNMWISSKQIPIKYHYQENQGKHIAINTGVEYCSSKYICIVDSDDYLVDNAVEVIRSKLLLLNNDIQLAGIGFCKGNYRDNILTNMGEFPDGIPYIEVLDKDRKKMKLTGEKLEIINKDIFINHPFPKFEGERYLSEGVLWGLLSLEGYKIRWYPDILCVCEYLEDGLTLTNQVKIKLENFNGYTYLTKMINMKQNGLIKYTSLGIYMFIAQKKGLNLKQIKENLEITWYDIVFGYFFFMLKKARG